ncbi:MAG TPA: GNAT family N-acetyltransferase [Candidatus Limnocylindrales bacterium]
MATRHVGEIDLAVDVVRSLEAHEARVHALPGREVRDLGDAVLLFDHRDREPFWNRVNAIRWPAATSSFDRRLAETIALFSTLDRIPHLRPRSTRNEPADLAARLEAFGFDVVGEDHVMVLDDPAPASQHVRSPLPPGVTIERLHAVPGADRKAPTAALSVVLTEAFGVEVDRRAAMDAETFALFDFPAFHALVVRVDGEPAAVAKRTTFDGATYLSSIGTRPAFRGRGLGSLAVATITADALASGDRWIHLGVAGANAGAIALYERFGFRRLGPPAPALLLR